MTTFDHPCVKYRCDGHEGIGFVTISDAVLEFHQGVLVLDSTDNIPIPWFDARMAGIEILEIEEEARALLQNAGYHLVGL